MSFVHVPHLFYYSMIVAKYLTGISHHCIQGFRLIMSHRDLPQVLTVSLSCDSTEWTYPVIARPSYPRRTCSKRRIYTARRRITTRQCSPYSWRSSDRESAICNSPSPRSSQKLLTRGTERWRTFRRVAKCWRVGWWRPWKETCPVQSRSGQVYPYQVCRGS